jgi:hypothetical protein
MGRGGVDSTSQSYTAELTCPFAVSYTGTQRLWKNVTIQK